MYVKDRPARLKAVFSGTIYTAKQLTPKTWCQARRDLPQAEIRNKLGIPPEVDRRSTYYSFKNVAVWPLALRATIYYDSMIPLPRVL
jgi:hypothetical protein